MLSEGIIQNTTQENISKDLSQQIQSKKNK